MDYHEMFEEWKKAMPYLWTQADSNQLEGMHFLSTHWDIEEKDKDFDLVIKCYSNGIISAKIEELRN